METSERRTLRQYRVTFRDNLEPLDILSHLYQEKVLTKGDMDRIKAENTRHERVEMLLDTIPRKGKRAYTKFADILEKTTGYSHLASLLNKNISATGDAVDVVDSGVSGSKSTPNKSNPQSLRNIAYKSEGPCYPINAKKHCLIINNDTFKGSGLPDRLGAKTDGKSVYNLFRELNFKVHYLENVDAKAMCRAFEDLGSADNTDIGCLAVVLMSHGRHETIFSFDSIPLNISSLIQPLLSERCSSLKGKPKLFIIQACRVKDEERTEKEESDLDKDVASNIEILSNPPGEGTTASHFYPGDHVQSERINALLTEGSKAMEADIVLAFSTLPATVSIRNINEGSWFIQAIVEIFTKYSSTEDVSSMLLRVNDRVSSRVSSQGFVQVPAPVVTLRRKLYLQ